MFEHNSNRMRDWIQYVISLYSEPMLQGTLLHSVEDYCAAFEVQRAYAHTEFDREFEAMVAAGIIVLSEPDSEVGDLSRVSIDDQYRLSSDSLRAAGTELMRVSNENVRKALAAIPPIGGSEHIVDLRKATIEDITMELKSRTSMNFVFAAEVTTPDGGTAVHFGWSNIHTGYGLATRAIRTIESRIDMEAMDSMVVESVSDDDDDAAIG